MTARKTAAQKRPAVKTTKTAKAKPRARTAAAKPTAKPLTKATPKPAAKAPRPAAKAPAPKAAAAKPAAARPAKPPIAEKPAAKAAPTPKVAARPAPAPIGIIKPITPAGASKTAAIAAKKPAAAAARSRPSAKTSFDPDRRRELIAAAAARHRKTAVTARTPLAPVAVASHREPSPAERHRFSVGDEVRVISTSGMWFKHGVEYRITAALPPQAGKLQYRIKNEAEPFERVVSESQLASIPTHG